jgi:hypothetical protein
MDMLLVRRRDKDASGAPFRCACGNVVRGWKPPFEMVARCTTCDRPEYHLLRANELTSDGKSREVVVAALGVVDVDRSAFESQGFHVLVPELGARFFRAEPPTITGDLTNPDGSVRILTLP